MASATVLGGVKTFSCSLRTDCEELCENIKYCDSKSRSKSHPLWRPSQARGSVFPRFPSSSLRAGPHSVPGGKILGRDGGRLPGKLFRMHASSVLAGFLQIPFKISKDERVSFRPQATREGGAGGNPNNPWAPQRSSLAANESVRAKDSRGFSSGV